MPASAARSTMPSDTGPRSTATSPSRPAPHVLQAGETLILDYSVILQGYRSDFTNTLVVGGNPTAEQRNLFGLCTMAMAAGERELKAGIPCQQVYDAVRGVFAAAGLADNFPHHA